MELLVLIAMSTAAAQVPGHVQGVRSPNHEQIATKFADNGLQTLDSKTIGSSSAASPTVCLGKTIGIYTDPASSNCFYFCYGTTFPGADASSDLGYRSCCGAGKAYTMPTLRYPVGACFDTPPRSPPPRSAQPPPPARPPPPPPLSPNCLTDAFVPTADSKFASPRPCLSSTDMQCS